MNEPEPTANRRILVVDDNPSIHDDFRKILGRKEGRKAGFADAKAMLFGVDPPESTRDQFELDSASQGEEGLQKVQRALAEGRPYALAFIDVRMPPGWDGVETVTRIWKCDPDLQVVICTAHSDYSWEEMIRQIGKTDSLAILKKPFDNIEVLQLAHALTQKWELRRQLQGRLSDLGRLVAERTAELLAANAQLKREIGERTAIERDLRLSEERFAKAFRSSPIPAGIFSVVRERLVDANPAFAEAIGYTREELLSRTFAELNVWQEPAGGEMSLRRLQELTPVREQSCRWRTKAGVMREMMLSAETLELEHEACILLIARDITEQLRLENLLRQAQKMEAIGQLAAGIAHDFNNILTVIQGHASLLLYEKSPGSDAYEALQTVSTAAARAARLIRQLLAFSHRQVMQMRTLDIRDTLAAMSLMFPRLLGEHIDVKIDAAPDLPLISADSGMMEQVLINLAVNARDAMPNGGQLVITAKAVNLDPGAVCGRGGANPGRYLCLSVTDTGCGMTPEVMARIFDPFFTTKPVGKGTGLGLATVYGIAKQHGGWVEVESEVGRGATFQIFIPESESFVTDGFGTPFVESMPGGRETILVVEDEEPVCAFVQKVLRSRGYTVFSAPSGPEALALWPKIQPKVDLLLTDLVMPGGMMGRELAALLLEKDPTLKVIFSSGYSPGMAGKDLKLLEGRNFLAKPYDPAQLTQLIREALDGIRKDGAPKESPP